MKRLAHFALQSPLQAMVVIGATAWLPLTIWLAAALLALVVLTRPPHQAMRISMVAVLSACIGVWGSGFLPLIGVTLITPVLAWTLRTTAAWKWPLSISIMLGATLALLIAPLWGDRFAPQGEQLAQQLESLLPVQQLPWLQTVLLEHYTAFMVMQSVSLSIVCLILARWLQAALFHPGEFGREFKQIHLPIRLLLLWGALLFLSVQWQPVTLDLILLPLVLQGLSLVHWLMQKKPNASRVLTVLYLLLVLFNQWMVIVLMIIAVIDAVVNIRRRRHLV